MRYLQDFIRWSSRRFIFISRGSEALRGEYSSPRASAAQAAEMKLACVSPEKRDNVNVGRRCATVYLPPCNSACNSIHRKSRRDTFAGGIVPPSDGTLEVSFPQAALHLPAVMKISSLRDHVRDFDFDTCKTLCGRGLSRRIRLSEPRFS